MRNVLLLLGVSIALAIPTAEAQSVTLSGGWTLSVPSATVTEAGTDYTQSITSPVNQSYLTIQDRKVVPLLTLGWEIRVSRIDSNWDSRLILKVVRTGNGVPTHVLSSISGGNMFTLINSTTAPFFTGVNTYDNIPLQYQLSGLSVLLPVKTYSTTIVYTLMN